MNGYIFQLLASDSSSQNNSGSVVFLVIGIILGVLLLIGGSITLVFVVANSFQNKKPKISVIGKLVGNQAYVTALDLYGQIKCVKSQDVSRALKAMQSVCDRLRNESDFGSGTLATINCENEIADCLASIANDIAGLYNENTFVAATDSVETSCQKILNKLQVRIRLKIK